MTQLDGVVPREPLSAEQDSADRADLQAAITDLAGLITNSFGLEALLARVALFTVRAIPGADGAGVTVLRADRPDNRVEALAASDAFVSEIDEIQYVTVNEGPCITAALEQRTVRTGSLGGERMWPRFGPRAGRLGVHSALSLPLILPPCGLVGAINVYAYAKDTFDAHAAELGEAFVKPAAVAVHNARVLNQARTVTAQLQQALSTRPVIEQAIGLLRGRSGCTEAEAFDRLRVVSQNEHRKLAEVAQRVVNEAVRRAHARRSHT